VRRNVCGAGGGVGMGVATGAAVATGAGLGAVGGSATAHAANARASKIPRTTERETFHHDRRDAMLYPHSCLGGVIAVRALGPFTGLHRPYYREGCKVCTVAYAV
jgi:hypothetical protein